MIFCTQREGKTSVEKAFDRYCRPTSILLYSVLISSPSGLRLVIPKNGSNVLSDTSSSLLIHSFVLLSIPSNYWSRNTFTPYMATLFRPVYPDQVISVGCDWIHSQTSLFPYYSPTFNSIFSRSIQAIVLRWW